MEIDDLKKRFSDSREHQIKAIFSTLFIAQNRLQTVFDREDPNITLKQFMLLTMLRQSEEALTFTEAGRLLGCSRQNVKKLALALEQKGFVEIGRNPQDVRAAVVRPTEQMRNYFSCVAGRHQEKLGLLFGGYTDEEIEQLFGLLMKLYQGMEELER